MTEVERLVLDIATRMPTQEVSFIGSQLRNVQGSLNACFQILVVIALLLVGILWRLW